MRKIFATMVAALVVVWMLAIWSATVRATGDFILLDPCDFITGGGFIRTPTMQKANFGAHGGCKHGAFWGHVNYVDHSGTHPFHVKSTDITAYFKHSDTGRTICGIADTNRGEDDVRFIVQMEDNGEPGLADRFGIALATVPPYAATGLVEGGNVKLHKSNRSHKPPLNPPPDPNVCPPPPDGGGGVPCGPNCSVVEGVCVCPPE